MKVKWIGLYRSKWATGNLVRSQESEQFLVPSSQLKAAGRLLRGLRAGTNNFNPLALLLEDETAEIKKYYFVLKTIAVVGGNQSSGVKNNSHFHHIFGACST
jgi:hypothetical protein